MQETERQDLTEQSNVLRSELKSWEKTFAATNNGQKASRSDIKQHPEIAAKYKEYNKVRDLLFGKTIPSKEEPKHLTPRKRKTEEGHTGASKRQHIIQTPLKGPIKPWDVDPYDSPSAVRNLFTPLKKTALGPTPQKDGQVLGLFDLLQAGTPLKAETTKTAGTKIPIQGTPRKLKPEDALRHSRTPASTGKRFMLDAFATPLKSRNPNDHGNKTPASISKLQFSTPSFLKRDNHRTQLPILNETEEGPSLSPEMIRVPRKPIVRGLSSILAGLRKMEEEAADEDLDALHEMEDEMAGISKKPVLKQPAAAAVPKNPMLVADSQPRLQLGGLDDEAMYDTEPEEQKDRDGQPLKVYKKKGQKRTTRRVNLKPTRSKPQSQSAAPPTADSDDELAPDANDEGVPETQIGDDFTAVGFTNARNFDSDTQSEYTASEGGTRYKRPDQSKKRKLMGKDGKIKTVARKANAMAHQNFKRLKLRNSGAKGGPGHNSRFRRRK